MSIKVTMSFEDASEVSEFFAARSRAVAPAAPAAPTAQETITSDIDILMEKLNDILMEKLNDILMEKLNDTRYRLRSMDSLCEATKLGDDDVLDLLNKHGIHFVTRNKSSTGELMVGLANRNA